MMGQNFIEVQRLNKNLIFFCINKKDISKIPFTTQRKLKSFLRKNLRIMKKTN